MAIKESEGNKIEKLRNAGYTLKQIGDELGYSKGYIHKYLKGNVKRLPDVGKVLNRDNANRSQKFSNRSQGQNQDLEALKGEIKNYVDNQINDIKQFFKTEIQELNKYKKQQKKQYGRQEFIKKVLREIDKDAYKKVLERLKTA